MQTAVTLNQLRTRKISPSIGLEVQEFDLSGLTAVTAQELRVLLRSHKVLAFRGQSLDDATFERAAAQFGELYLHPILPHFEGTRAVIEFNAQRGGANFWHTDLTFMDRFPSICILKAHTLPPCGGDTIFANTQTAYECLPAPLKAFVDSASGIHSNVINYSQVQFISNAAQQERYRDVYTSKRFVARHPLRWGDSPSLLAGSFLVEIEGLSAAQSAAMRSLLEAHIAQPEFCMRWTWAPGDVLMWENLSTAHRATADIGSQERILKRICIQ